MQPPAWMLIWRLFRDLIDNPAIQSLIAASKALSAGGGSSGSGGIKSSSGQDGSLQRSRNKSSAAAAAAAGGRQSLTPVKKPAVSGDDEEFNRLVAQLQSPPAAAAAAAHSGSGDGDGEEKAADGSRDDAAGGFAKKFPAYSSGRLHMVTLDAKKLRRFGRLGLLTPAVANQNLMCSRLQCRQLYHRLSSFQALAVFPPLVCHAAQMKSKGTCLLLEPAC